MSKAHKTFQEQEIYESINPKELWMMLEMTLDAMSKSRRLSHDPTPWKPIMPHARDTLMPIINLLSDISKSFNDTDGMPLHLFYSLITKISTDVSINSFYYSVVDILCSMFEEFYKLHLALFVNQAL